MRKTKDFNWVLNNGYFDNLTYGYGLNLFLLDTGVFIDLESNYYNNGQTGAHPALLLERINHPLIITAGVMEEIKSHRESVVGRRYEISAPTSILVRRLFEESIDFLKSSSMKYLDLEVLDLDRLQVYYAFNDAFKRDFRKREKDPLSSADKELISMALHLTRCYYYEKPITAVNILSPDEHISKIINLLKANNYLNERIVRAIPTRRDLRSYLKSEPSVLEMKASKNAKNKQSKKLFRKVLSEPRS